MENHKDRKHAVLSASGSSRWINCPPSVRMEENIPDPNKESIYAAEGTLAHEIADLKLRRMSHIGPVGSGTKYLQWAKQGERLMQSELYNPEMDQHVDLYTTYVMEAWTLVKKSTQDALLKIEEKVDFSYLVPDGFGTVDACIMGEGVMEIIDFKYGKGVKVNAKDNSQLRLYALGALNVYRLLYDVEFVKLTIVQPRLDHIDSEIIGVESLDTWGESVVQPAAEDAYKGQGKCNPGDWCRWCKAKPICRALANHNLELAKKEFADPHTLDKGEILEAYKQSGLLVDWANSLAKYMLDEAIKGNSWDGYKLVEGRSNRRWADEQKAIYWILDQNDAIENDQVLNTKIKSITDIEKLLGKGTVDHLLVKPPGSPTLVPESDKRPALGIEQAKLDFK